MLLQHISAAYSPKQMHRIVTPVLKATFFCWWVVGKGRPLLPPCPRLATTTIWWGLENFCHWRARTQKKIDFSSLGVSPALSSLAQWVDQATTDDIVSDTVPVYFPVFKAMDCLKVADWVELMASVLSIKMKLHHCSECSVQCDLELETNALPETFKV